jgi:hypothetical protein
MIHATQLAVTRYAFDSKGLETVMTIDPKKPDGVELKTDDVRQGETGHHVRYILIGGLVSALVGLALVLIIFAN